MPDLVVVSYHPQVFALSQLPLSDTQVLAYLRAVGRANLNSIVERMRVPRKRISRVIDGLVDVEAVAVAGDTFYLPALWRRNLPEIITIEVKVSRWQKAIEQAGRNRIFAHRSYSLHFHSACCGACKARTVI